MTLGELECIDNNIDINTYITFREMIKSSMKYPEWLGDFTKEDLIEMLDKQTKIWIYYLQNEPVCSMMIIPSTDEALKKLNVKFLSKDVIDYGPMFVNPKYIGNGLQYQMLQELDEYCFKLGFKHAVVTVHPDNHYSINNLIKDNFILIGTKEFTRGIRNIYLKTY